MFTLGYNKYYNSLYKQNLDPKFGLFQIPGPDEDAVLAHIDTVHYVNVPSADISNKIVSHQVQKGLTSDLITDGKFMKDFTPTPTVVNKLGYGMLEGAAHHYFNETQYIVVVDSTMNYTEFKKGRRFYMDTFKGVRCDIGTPEGEVFPNSYIRFHSPAVIHRYDVNEKPNKINSLTEISPDVYKNNPVEVFDTQLNFRWNANDKRSGMYQLDPDVLPPQGFINYDELTSHPAVAFALDHITQKDIHPGSWVTPELSSTTTVSSEVIDSIYANNTIRYRPSTGDWFVSPDKKSYSYEAQLTEAEGHWLAISIGDPDAKVTDPDDPNLILGQCVNGTDEMRCYFTLDKDKFPVATSTVLLRRCNPIMGFKALTLPDVSS